jgi:hypothetical protein
VNFTVAQTDDDDHRGDHAARAVTPRRSTTTPASWKPSSAPYYMPDHDELLKEYIAVIESGLHHSLIEIIPFRCRGGGHIPETARPVLPLSPTPLETERT